MKFNKLSFISFALLAALSVNAATSTFSSSDPGIGSTVDAFLGEDGIVDIANISQFDASGIPVGAGQSVQLLSVSLSITASETTTWLIDNPGAEDTFIVSMIDSPTLGINYQGASIASELQSFSKSFDIPAAATAHPISATAPLTASRALSVAGGDDLSSFVGGGNLENLNVNFGTTWSVGGYSGGGDSAELTADSVIVDWEIVYTYEIVPEPSSLALVLLGVVALGLRRKRRGSV